MKDVRAQMFPHLRSSKSCHTVRQILIFAGQNAEKNETKRGAQYTRFGIRRIEDHAFLETFVYFETI